jgi:23S rRNA pseudouridine2457 synthase
VNTAKQRRAAGRTGSGAGSGAGPRVILLNKPYGVLCQFTAAGSGRPTLKDHVPIPDFYPAGRLDADSEGLVVLTADGALQARIASPRAKLAKVYWAEVEGEATEARLAALERGVDLGDFVTAPARARAMRAPERLWPRDPPIRFRKSVPTCWIEVTLTEGKNRQVRRMTAAVGLPTLRLVRYAVGPWTLDGLAPGAWREESAGSRVLSSGRVR